MPTFAPPPTLPDRITRALATLRAARERGDTDELAVEALLNALLDRLPRKAGE